MRGWLIGLMLISSSIYAQGSRELPPDDGPWVVRAYFDQDASLNLLLRRAAPWQVDRDLGVLTIEVENRFEYQQLLNDGFRVEIDTALSRQMYDPPAEVLGQQSGIVGFPCYRLVEETFATGDALIAAAPGIAEWVDIGDSWRKQQNAAEGYDLRVLRLTNRAIPGPKPVHYLQGGLHAREYVTAETVTRYAEFLANGYGVNPDVTWLLDYQEVHLLLQANPDGRKVAEISANRNQRKNRNSNFCPTGTTTVGVDLNRNFPFDWGGPGSSTNQCSDVFRGPGAQSEPESIAIINYLRSIFLDQRNEGPGVDLTTPISLDATGVYMDVHSNAARTWWSWGNVDGVTAPNGTQLQTLGRKISFYNQYRPEQANAGGAIGGATDDFTFGTLGVPAYTVELGGTSFFPSCASYESTIAQRNIDGFFYASKVARAPYRLPAGPELIDVSASVIGANVVVAARADDARFNNSAGTEPTQAVTDVAVFVTPPWQAGAVALAQATADDGAFNSNSEAVTATIAVASLSPARQLLYLQATDAAGNRGPVGAVFVEPDLVFRNGFEAAAAVVP